LQNYSTLLIKNSMERLVVSLIEWNVKNSRSSPQAAFEYSTSNKRMIGFNVVMLYPLHASNRLPCQHEHFFKFNWPYEAIIRAVVPTNCNLLLLHPILDRKRSVKDMPNCNVCSSKLNSLETSISQSTRIERMPGCIEACFFIPHRQNNIRDRSVNRNAQVLMVVVVFCSRRWASRRRKSPLWPSKMRWNCLPLT
ncbi:hypothetical protein T12_15145, partial [Trichinella patagoniensis]